MRATDSNPYQQNESTPVEENKEELAVENGDELEFGDQIDDDQEEQKVES